MNVGRLGEIWKGEVGYGAGVPVSVIEQLIIVRKTKLESRITILRFMTPPFERTGSYEKIVSCQVKVRLTCTLFTPIHSSQQAGLMGGRRKRRHLP